jgi:hypothetical protein
LIVLSKFLKKHYLDAAALNFLSTPSLGLRIRVWKVGRGKLEETEAFNDFKEL